MPAISIQQAFDLALRHHQAGGLAEAESIYRQILAHAPGHADALQFLGVIASQTGRHDEAVNLLRQAAALAPGSAAIHSNLGEACRKAGLLDEAILCLRRAAELQPTLAEVHSNLGNALLEKGRIPDAVAACRRAIELRPDFAQAHSNLGSALRELGRLEEAIAACTKAVRLAPGNAEAHGNLANALRDADRIEESITSHRRALSLKPQDPILLNNLAATLSSQGRARGAAAEDPRGSAQPAVKHEAAVAAARRDVEMQPDSADAHVNLGNALLMAGLPGATDAFRKAIALEPKSANAHANLATALRQHGLHDEAVTHCRRAIELDPGCAISHNTLGAVLSEQGRLAEAASAFQRALELQPGYALAQNNLSNVLGDLGRLDEAIATYREALRVKPGYAEAHSNLGNALKDSGRVEEALDCYRRAIELKPDFAGAHSNLAYVAQFHPGFDRGALREECVRWSARHEAPLSRCILPHANVPEPERRLRVGYVSPDFRDHVIGRNLLPLFAHHDREEFEVHCYSGVAQPDALTERFHSLADHWRTTLGVSDAELAATIRADQVDILVDLSQHMAGNRLTLFARQPAPVQFSFAGYPDSTGLKSIRHRITDRLLEPTPAGDGERIHFLESFWCYDPCGVETEIGALPALASGMVTFGCLNNFCKITEPVLMLWARVLAQVENSRLLLMSPPGSHRARLLAVLAKEGVDARRVTFVAHQPRRDYLTTYHRIDIGLDTFPYNGHTTTLDALWMGVPVISLAGPTPASRAGLSVLTHLGLADWVASSGDEYVEKAAALAGELPRLAAARASLRERMKASVLTDAPRFARQIEQCYRDAWQAWCAEQSDAGTTGRPG